MIRLHRVKLPQAALDELASCKADITGAGQSRKESARERFKTARQTNLFKVTVETALKSMNNGSALCFYCLNDRGIAVDHYRPIDNNPDEAFTWDNYVWSCTPCNSLEKNRDFPVDEAGNPLLLNPVDTDPYSYLPLNRDGEVLVFEEYPYEDDEAKQKRLINEATIKTLGLNAHQDLITERKQAWQLIEACLPSYQAGNMPKRLEIKTLLLESPIVVAVLAYMHHTLQTNPDAATILDQQLYDMLVACPEIQFWVNPVLRAGEDELLVMRQLHGKRVIDVAVSDDTFCLVFEGGARVLTSATDAPKANGRKLLNAYNQKGNIVFHFYGVTLIAAPNEWVFEVS